MHLKRSILGHVKATAFAVPVVSSYELDEFLSTLDEFRFDSKPSWMVSKWKHRKGFSPSRTSELGNPLFNCGLTKHNAIVVSISTTEAVVLSFEVVFLLLAAVENHTAILLSAKTSGIKGLIGLEERPEKVISDFTVLLGADGAEHR
ncbi:hypothetical protein GJ744_003640 [Endocarpon pusillum]|uniref:Uncharacterized protein n=1 Tax=Endocarpon pusillum TaxID=364733 RepID=A0A8H7A7I4_9EURO|nr:hypothetical protein GJ744_003640 [Endocarpon pusillum]